MEVKNAVTSSSTSTEFSTKIILLQAIQYMAERWQKVSIATFKTAFSTIIFCGQEASLLLLDTSYG